MTDTEATGAPDPIGQAVVHQANDARGAHLALVGTDQQVVQSIGTLPHSNGSQFSYTAVSDRYIAFIYALTNGQEAQSLWDLYLFNRATGRLMLVTHSPRDAHGMPLQSGWVEPLLSDTYLYWLQAAQTGLPWGGSELEQYNLRTGHIRTLYRGLVEAEVLVGTSVIYTAVAPRANRAAPEPPMIMAAVDQNSGKPVPVPPGITAAKDGAFSIRYSDGTMIWNTTDAALRAWRQEWGHSITLVPALGWPLGQKLGLSGPGYPRIYRQFVVWEPGNVYVLDLKTNSFTRLSSHAGGEELSGSRLSIEQYTSAVKPTVGTYVFDQAVIDLATLPDLDACN